MIANAVTDGCNNPPADRQSRLALLAREVVLQAEDPIQDQYFYEKIFDQTKLEGVAL